LKRTALDMDLEEGRNDLCQPLLCDGDGSGVTSNSNAKCNGSGSSRNQKIEETSNDISFWGDGTNNDDDDDDSGDDSHASSNNAESEIDSSRCQSTGQEIISIAVPALAGLAIDPLMTLADTAFVGRTSDDATALAGMGSAAALLTFAFYLFNFLCTVTTPLVSQRRAAGDDRGAIEIGGQALSLAMLLGITLSGVLVGFSDPLLKAMGIGKTGIAARSYALSFLGVRAIAAPAVFVNSASTGILRGYLDTRTTFVILLGSNLVNISLDVVLIWWLRMGPKGAAIATTTTEWICAVSLLLILAGIIPSVDGKLGSNQPGRHSTTNWEVSRTTQQIEILEESGDSDLSERESKIAVTPALKIPSWEEIQPLVVASSSVFVRTFMLQLSIAGAAAMATRSGEGAGSEAASASIAAHQIALQLWLLCSFVCDALAAASQALVADRLGREDAVGVRDVSKTIFVYSFVLGSILAAALGVGKYSGFLLNLFTSDKSTQDALKPLLLLLVGAQPLNSFVFAADGVLQGASLFAYQAKSMVLSVVIAFATFFGLQYVSDKESHPGSTLIYVWYSLVILQLMRGITSLWKLIERNGPIDILGR